MDTEIHRVTDDATVYASSSTAEGWHVQAYDGRFVDIEVSNIGHRACLRVPADIIDAAAQALHLCRRGVRS